MDFAFKIGARGTVPIPEKKIDGISRVNAILAICMAATALPKLEKQSSESCLSELAFAN